MSDISRLHPKHWAFDFCLMFLVWLLLTNSLSPGNLVLAAVVAITIPLTVRKLVMRRSIVHKPWKLISYLGVMLWDIVVSNLIVAKQVLGSPHKLQPGFIAIPLDLSEPMPITLLASTISLTPGTVSTEVSKDLTVLYVHALHIDDEQGMIQTIKQRYEKPLKDIFQC